MAGLTDNQDGLNTTQSQSSVHSPSVHLQPPLSRKGTGPGLIIVLPEHYSPTESNSKKTLDPEPMKKWAEEGFAVAQLKFNVNRSLSSVSVENALESGLKALRELPECDSDGKVGLIIHNLDFEISDPALGYFWAHAWREPSVAAIVTFSGYPPTIPESAVPILLHHSAILPEVVSRNVDVAHGYDGVLSTNFVLPGHDHYTSSASNVAHTRSLGFLKKYLGGPKFDLEKIWDEHMFFEFGERHVEKTMATMVDEPYVNHVPTLTGGIGRAALTNFYREHFVYTNPEDTKIELISRTVGVDRVIDEFIASFTHDKVIDWMLPGMPPTGKFVRIPCTSVVNVRGDRLYHEHIAWDQSSVLRQLGLLPEYLPFPYPLLDGRSPGKGKRFEYRVPSAGVETARKMVDEQSEPSNTMLGFEIREVDDV